MTFPGGSVIQGFFPQGVPRIPVPPPACPSLPTAILRRTSQGPVPPPPAPAVPRPGSNAFLLPARLAPVAGAGGQRLHPDVQRKMEAVFQASFSDVRVHVGPQATAIGALAFAQGSNLFFAPGHYDPLTARGQQLLAHELAHVVQQRAGRVKNPFGSGVAVVHDRTLELEAERMGHRVAQPTPAPPSRPPAQAKPAALPGRPGAPAVVAQGSILPVAPWTGAAVVQRMKKSEKGDVAMANLLVIGSYSSDTFRNVRNAFLKAGYTSSNWVKAAKKALKSSRWSGEKIAHSLGKEGMSGKRGGTDEEVQECARYLIDWAGSNPPPETCKPDLSKYYYRKGPDDDDKGGKGGGSKGSSFVYVPPWQGGPSAWYAHRTDTY